MCSVIVLRRPGHAWPLIVAANRDERLDRAWDPPAGHWPGIVGGLDRVAGGTWLALGPHGVLAAVLNRPGSLGPQAGKRSRGDLPLLAAGATSAAAGAALLAGLDATQYRPFNLVVADRATAFFLAGLGERIVTRPLDAGIVMVTAHDPNDLASPRIRRHLPRFQAAPPPDPERDDWTSWEALLADSDMADGHAATLNVPPAGGFGTVCASLVALGAAGDRRWRFCPGPPGLRRWHDLPL